MADRQRLDQVDAMRPIKQAGVVSTHTIIAFTPSTATVYSNAALLLLHVSRDAFFFISACMLTYAYYDLKRSQLRRFYWRRFVSVGIPYLCWNAIYFLWFLYVLRQTSYASPLRAAQSFGRQLEVGYDQLYFLIVIMEFYLLFPLLLIMLKKTRGHHGLVLAVALAVQIAVSIGMHWHLFPAKMMSGQYAQEDILNYVLYLAGGAIVACHMTTVHDWVVRNAVLVVYFTAIGLVFAEGVYFMARAGITTDLGSGSDPFQPCVIPFNVGILGCVYLAGMWLVRPERSWRIRAATRVGADDSYGIYLAQMIFITALASFGWRDFAGREPFWIWLPLTVAIVYAGSIALTAVLARTPLAVPLTGRKRATWHTFLRTGRLSAAASSGAGSLVVTCGADPVSAGYATPFAPWVSLEKVPDAPGGLAGPDLARLATTEELDGIPGDAG
jgi:peptidoglycan/LPS O-acetylase OafA/YrhL